MTQFQSPDWGSWGFLDFRAVSTIVGHTAQRNENADDIMAGATALGQQRSSILQRENQIEDLIISLSLFCWWPFKPSLFEGSRQYLLENRWNLFEGAQVNEFSRIRILQVVPDRILTLDTSELFLQLQTRFITQLIDL